jgi:hypothetical protein
VLVSFLYPVHSRQLTCRSDYNRFIERWAIAHSSDGEFGVPFPENLVELPSSELNGNQMNGNTSPDEFGEPVSGSDLPDHFTSHSTS